MIQLQKAHTWLLLILASALSVTSFSQSLTGIWRGYFISSSGENYKLEFQVKQGTSYSVSGVSYSYLDVRFYGKATMTGTFVKNSKTFRIKEIKTVEVKNMSGGGTCIMNYDLQYSRSGNEEFLEGTFLGKPETLAKPNPYKWGDCGGGKVFLRRVVESDFYVEPFLRNNTIKPKTNTPPPTAKTIPPANKPKKDAPPPVTKKVTPPKEKKADTVANKIDDTKKPVIVNRPPAVVPDVLTKRQNELMKALIINSPEVTVKLYDNGEIDDDTISVYLDKKLVLSGKRLTASPLTVKLKMDEENPNHELVMVAENLGRIPPNTSLMVVEAGEQRYEIRITSTEQKNAVVKFNYQPK